MQDNDIAIGLNIAPPARDDVKSAPISDWQLLRRVRDGDDAAFEELIRRYEARLLAYVTRYAGSYDSSRDLVQETFIRLLTKPPRARTASTLAPWLFRVARNLALDRIRRRKHEVVPAGDDLDQIPSDDDPRREVRDRHDTEYVRRLAAQLPADLRDVVYLRLYGEVSFREIAATLGIPQGTALWRMHRAVQLMREQWQAETAAAESPGTPRGMQGTTGRALSTA